MNLDDHRLEDLLADCRAGADEALLQSRSFPAQSGKQVEAAKQQHIEAISRAIRNVPVERMKARNRYGWLSAAAGVCLFAAAGGAWWQLSHSPGEAVARVDVVKTGERPSATLRQVVGKVLATRGGQDRVVDVNTAVVDGDELSTTAEAFATMDLEDGARVDLANATTLRVDRAEARNALMQLRAGRVDVSVPKLAEGEQRNFEVRTPDTRVVVRGTIFSVEVLSAGLRPSTRVSVSRGAVAVFHEGEEHQVRAGETWLSQALEDSAESGEPQEKVDESAPPKRRAVKTQPKAQSSLTEQNRLFQLGITARNQGDHRTAAFWFRRLMKKYPNSPLKASAQRELSAARERL